MVADPLPIDPWSELVGGLRAQVEVLALTRAPGVPAASPAVGAPAPSFAPAPTPGDDRGAALDSIRAEIGDCTRCQLHRRRHHIVFGQGDPAAELVFVGEGPGEDEDRQGIPFVGKAGELLTRMIGAMGLTRDQVYICNIVKCRPPNNRDPEPDEVAACEPFLRAQLAAIKPRVIVALGRCAAQTLLGVKVPISRLRGKWASYQGIPLMPTFHPAYLLRNAGGKRPVWEDLKEVMHRLGRFSRDQEPSREAGAGSLRDEEP
ncbi:MAG: uracil-DNA glycosylase [Deltaproteobacteria bacterium]|nr:uracil-DNA glycosylase [Deltaproteobacteria bacterium]